MELLLAYGADAAARDGESDGALQYMSRRFSAAHLDMVQLLTPNSVSHES